MSAPGHGLYDGQLHAAQAAEGIGPGNDPEQGFVPVTHALLAVHAELAAMRALAEDTIQRVMGSRPGVQVTKTAAGVRVTENLTADQLRPGGFGEAHAARMAEHDGVSERSFRTGGMRS